MKKMTCKQLGGACDLEFHAATFEEMADLSKKHGIEMFEKKDIPHLRAMKEMKESMQAPDAFDLWFEGKRKEFNALAENQG